MVIAVNAVSGGGKTTVANALHTKLGNSEILYFNSYGDTDKNIPDIQQWIFDGANYDLWHLDEMAADIKRLLEKADNSQNIEHIILDYPFGYKQKQIGGYINLSVYIDTPLDIALARRIIRDISPQTQVDEIITQLTGYLNARNAYSYSQLENSDADIKIDGSLSVNVITNIIIQKIEEYKY